MAEFAFDFAVELEPDKSPSPIFLPRITLNENWAKLELTCKDKPTVDFWLELVVNETYHHSCTALGVFLGENRRFFYGDAIRGGDTAYFKITLLSTISHPEKVRFQLSGDRSFGEKNSG
jgi:hypothetical protein